MCTHCVRQHEDNVLHSWALSPMIFRDWTKLPVLDVCTSHYETHLPQMNVFIRYHTYTGKNPKTCCMHCWVTYENSILMKLKTSHYDSDLSLQFGGKGREEGTTTWTGLTWVRRTAKGTKCEANQSRNCRAPCKSFTPSSGCTAQPLCPSPALISPRHAGQEPVLSSTL